MASQDPSNGEGSNTGQRDGFSLWRFWLSLPEFIKAITPLVLGAVAGGVGVSVATSSNASQGAPRPTVTEVVTVTASGAAKPLWAGSVTFGCDDNNVTARGGYDFDYSPPRPITGKDIAAVQYGSCVGSVLIGDAGSGVLFARWAALNGSPSKHGCDDLIAHNAQTALEHLTPGSAICARTADGHTLSIEVTEINPLVGTVTVWN
jgi:hypothetical protein